MSTHVRSSSFTKIVTKCLVTQADTAHDSKATTAHSREPISALTLTHISHRVYPYRPSRAPQSHL